MVNKERKNDLTGKEIGFLKVIEPIPRGKYKCICKCGKEVIKRQYDLERFSKPSCGCRGSLKSNKSKNKGFIDMTNKTLYELTFLNYIGKGIWKVRCSCGKEFKVQASMVRNGNTTSCGHTRKESRLIDLSGKQFGEWKVLDYAGNSYWNCKCSCGITKEVHSYSLRNKKSTNCGSSSHRVKNIQNKTFGDLEVKEYKGNGVWICKCSCGNTKDVLGINLRNGSTTSCGCKTTDNMKETLLERYGDTSPRKAKCPRTKEQIETINDREKLSIYLKDKFSNNGNKKLSSEIISESLGVSKVTLLTHIKEFKLDEYIDLNEFSNKSSYEKELMQLFPGGKQSDRSVLLNRELDIYYKDKNFAIEFNGSYWHSTIYKDKNYHRQKTIDCAKKGVRLLHIFEYEWKDTTKKQKIINILNDILSTEKEVIYGRKTEVKEIENKVAKKFTDKYHLQNYVESSINIGCYYNNELLGVMSLSKPRFNPNYQYEITRLCWKTGKVVIGGTEKIFKYFLRKYNPQSVITYCDISKFTGDGYVKLGFTPINQNPLTEPNYIWLEPRTNKILSRYQTQKHILVEKGFGKQDETESEIMSKLGFIKVYDSGNLRLEYKAI